MSFLTKRLMTERGELPAIEDAGGGENAEEILAIAPPADEAEELPKAGGDPPAPAPHVDDKFDEVSDSGSDEERPATFNKVRKYKNSTRPRNVNSAMWTRFSEAQKKEAIQSYIELKAEYKAAKAAARAAAPRAAPLVSRGFRSEDYVQLKKAVKKAKEKVAKTSVAAAAVTGIRQSDDPPAPAMPVLIGRQWSHRDRRQVQELLFSACVARTVNKAEVRTNDKALQALLKEWDKLRAAGTWDETKVQEWSAVSAAARKSNESVHVGLIFEICVGKGSELKESSFKATK